MQPRTPPWLRMSPNPVRVPQPKSRPLPSNPKYNPDPDPSPDAKPHTTQENAYNYDKGVLAEILEPIMGKGLIPADLETWKPRRRAIVPAFHRAYLEAMVRSCASTLLGPIFHPG